MRAEVELLRRRLQDDKDEKFKILPDKINVLIQNNQLLIGEVFCYFM